MQEDNIEILLIGKTGHGKSSLGNFLLGNMNYFKVYDTSKSGTQTTMEKDVNGLSIIDTPGLLDSENNSNRDVDSEHYQEMIGFIKTKKRLKGILLVMNAQEPRFSQDIQAMIKIICNSFNYKTFKSIALVFTHFFGKKNVKNTIRNSKMEFVTQTKELIERFYEEEIKLEKKENTLKYILEPFFIDCDLEDPDEDSLEEREKILMWAKGLPFINVKELEIKDPRYKKIYEEFDNNITTDEDSNYIYKQTIIYKYTKAIDLDDNKITLKKEIADTINIKIPKKKSFWKKLLGGIMIGVGVLSAPFSMGASLVGVGGGIATLATG